MRRLLSAALVTLIGLMLLGCLIVQLWIIPKLASEAGTIFPPTGVTVWVVAGIVMAGIACVEIVLVCTLLLLRMVTRKSIFSSATATRIVDVVIGSIVLATALAVTLFVIFVWVLDETPPGLALLCMCATILGGALALLVVVMRQLLRTASSLHDELAEVV